KEEKSKKEREKMRKDLQSRLYKGLKQIDFQYQDKNKEQDNEERITKGIFPQPGSILGSNRLQAQEDYKQHLSRRGRMKYPSASMRLSNIIGNNNRIPKFQVNSKGQINYNVSAQYVESNTGPKRQKFELADILGRSKKDILESSLLAHAEVSTVQKKANTARVCIYYE
ncbi:MAG: hypothetical protein EZS28_051947, partial [Streblomastix strix]